MNILDLSLVSPQAEWWCFSVVWT